MELWCETIEGHFWLHIEALYIDQIQKKNIDQIQNPEVAEAIAVRQALIAAEDAGFHKIQVVSDCLSLMKKVHDVSFDRSASGAIVQDIKVRPQSSSLVILSMSNVVVMRQLMY